VAKPNYDLIAVDLDGTLFGPDGKVSEANRRAVRAAREAGIEVVICTGRGVAESGAAIKAIEANVPARGREVAPIVVAGGAMVADARTGRTLHRWPMDAGLVRRVCGHFARAGRAPLVLKDRDAAGFDYLVVNSGPIEYPTQWWFEVMDVEVKFVEHIDHDKHPEHTVRVGFAALTPVMMQLAKSVQAEFGLETSVQHFPAVAGIKERMAEGPRGTEGVRDENVQLLEVFDRQVSKWTAIYQLAQAQGIPRERVAAIGDEINDLTMIEGAGLGIAMGNAVERVKQVANVETADHTHDGVAEAIEKILRGEW
jgi:hydroxymethylpyrimidine pyrophosphatase-like HAD family hydrolase